MPNGLARWYNAFYKAALEDPVMNIADFKHNDCFALLDLEACFEFKTETSISFQLGRHSRSRNAFSAHGWLDVHHPVPGEYVPKACLRIALPSKYLQFEHKALLLEQFREVVATVFAALQIPEGEVYAAHFFTPEYQQSVFIEEPGTQYNQAVRQRER